MRLRTFLIGLLVVVLLLLASGCGVVLLAAASLPSGELPEVDFRNPEISADRAAIVPELETQLDEVERRYGAEHVGPRLRIDRCEEGQDNFTRTDGYAYSCRMQIVQIMAVGHPLERNRPRLSVALVEATCPGAGDCRPGLHVSAPELMEWLPATPTADELESARFYLRCEESIYEAYCESSSPILAAAAATAPADAAALAVVVAEDDYHEVPWDCPWPASWVRDICQS